MPRSATVNSWYDRDKILAEFARHGFDRDMTAKEIGCHPTTVSWHARADAKSAGKPNVGRIIGGNTKRAPQIRWNKDSIAKLIAILERRPLPSNAAIAEEMGVSKGALQTAMSRFNLASHMHKPLLDRRVRPCMNCDSPFGSEGIGNRLCRRCGGMGSVNQEASYAT
jgi:hypothetical protein